MLFFSTTKQNLKKFDNAAQLRSSSALLGQLQKRLAENGPSGW
jgi:hypothetical protein